MLPPEICERGHDEIRTVFRRRCHSQTSCERTLANARLLYCSVGIGKHTHAIMIETLAHFRQCETSGRACEKGHAQFGFKLLQVKAGHGFCNTEDMGGSRKG